MNTANYLKTILLATGLSMATVATADLNQQAITVKAEVITVAEVMAESGEIDFGQISPTAAANSVAPIGIRLCLYSASDAMSIKIKSTNLPEPTDNMQGRLMGSNGGIIHYGVGITSPQNNLLNPPLDGSFEQNVPANMLSLAPCSIAADYTRAKIAVTLQLDPGATPMIKGDYQDTITIFVTAA